MSTENTLNEVRAKLIHKAERLGIEVVYAEYDFETSHWNIELRLEQTLPPNPDNTSEVRIVECITNRVNARIEHDHEVRGIATEKVHKHVHTLVAELHAVGILSLRQAQADRMQPAYK